MNHPPEIAKLYIEAGTRKARLSIPKMIVLSIYGGFFISSGALCSLACSFRMSGGDARFYNGLVFPIGLMLVLCAGAELFTENCLMVIPLFCRQISISEMLLNWLIVFFGNFIGSLIMAVLVVYGHVTHLFDYSLAQLSVTNAIELSTNGFGEEFVKGVLGNFCICLAVWLSFGARDLFSKIAALWGPTLLMAACGYEHVVSNMFYIPAGIFASYEYDLPRPSLNWGRLFYKNLIPVTLGNLIGGAILVGFGYWYVYLTPNLYGEIVQKPLPITQINK